MSLPNLLTSLALVVLFSAILFFYFNRMFKQLDDKVNTCMDLFHGRLEDIANRALMNGGGRGQSTQNTINLYDLNEESIQTSHIQADSKIVVSDDSDSESESDSDSESESDGESSEEGEEQVQLVKNEEGDNEEGDNEEKEQPNNEDTTKQMVEELLLPNVNIEDVEDLHVDPDVKVIKSLEKVEDETVGEISKKEDGVATDDDEDDSLDDDESESESESEVDEEENAEKEAEIKKLKAMTTKQLKSLAKERKLKKYKSLTKTKLVELLVSK